MKRLIGFLIAWALCAAPLAGCASSGMQEASNSESSSAASSETADASQSGSDTSASSHSQTGGAAATQKAQSDEGAAYTTREIWVDNDGQRIYGVAYLPDGTDTAPLVILSHGLGNDHTATAPYAQQLAENGYAAYVFDFRGGTTGGNNSDGENTDMSVMTEASDLEAVIDASKDWDFVNHDQITLAGESQGGMVTAVVAARHPNAAQAIVLLYPALSIVDDAHDQFSSESAIPTTYEIFGGWMTVSRKYATDIWDYDVYSEIGKYTGPVLIEHGNQDSIVPVSYSRRAAKTYENATLKVLKGADHGFTGSYFDTAADNMVDFLNKHIDR